jgi:hypothetical protein
VCVRAALALSAAVVFVGVGGLGAPDAGAAVGPPSVSGVSATAGPLAGGNRVTVTGSHFGAGVGVLFGRVRAAGVRVISASKLVASAPRHTAGRVDVRVVMRAGQSAVTPRDRYTFLPAPAVSAVAPSEDALVGGHRITIVGQNLAAVTAVRFGTAAGRSLTHISSTKIAVTDPAHADGVVDVRVLSAGGGSAMVPGDRFAFVGRPVVTRVLAGSGPLTAATPVTITGRDFVHVTSVRFGSQPASGVAVLSPTTLRAAAPAGSAGPVDVQVSTRYGTSAVGAADRYTYMPAPAVPTVATTMAPEPSGFPSGSDLALTSSACDAANSCYAVGQDTTQFSEVGVIETLANGTWSATTAPVPADGVPNPVMELRSIACPAPGRCVAVGGYINNDNYLRPLVETLSNGTWTAQALGVAQGTTDAYLTYLKCPSTTSCVATGPGQHGTTLALMNGSAWTIGLAPVPAGLDPVKFTPSDAACSSLSCVVVGEYVDGTELRGMTEIWTGSAWRAAMAGPASGGTYPVFLNAVDCLPSGQCVAVGRDRPLGVASDVAAARPLTVTLANGRWTSAPAPMPADAVTPALDELWSVSCAGGSCVAVGSYDTANATSGLVERIDDGVDTPAEVTPSTPDTRLMLMSVSCFTAGSCRIAGSSGPSNTPVVATTGPGGTALTAAPAAAGAPSGTATLSRIRCSADAFCVGIVDIRPDAGPSQYELLTAH